MKLEVTLPHFEEILRKGLSVDAVLLLKFLQGKEKEEILNLIKYNDKANSLFQTLVRKFYITSEGLVTLDGKNLIEFLNLPHNIGIQKKPIDISSFETWWSIFPGTDTFTHKGKKFIGTRALRVNKAKCKKYFEDTLKKGVYTAEEIISATQYDINLKKENSVKKDSNQLTFMQNSGTYLYNEVYEAFISLVKQDIPISEGATKALDIDI